MLLPGRTPSRASRCCFACRSGALRVRPECAPRCRPSAPRPHPQAGFRVRPGRSPAAPPGAAGPHTGPHPGALSGDRREHHRPRFPGRAGEPVSVRAEHSGLWRSPRPRPAGGSGIPSRSRLRPRPCQGPAERVGARPAGLLRDGGVLADVGAGDEDREGDPQAGHDARVDPAGCAASTTSATRWPGAVKPAKVSPALNRRRSSREPQSGHGASPPSPGRGPAESSAERPQERPQIVRPAGHTALRTFLRTLARVHAPVPSY